MDNNAAREPQMTKRSKVAITGALLVLYLGGYVVFRSEHFIVHSVVRDHGQNYLEHSVVSGDGRFLGGVIKGSVAIFYTPLRLIEARYCYWRQPVGTPLSLAHRTRLPG